MSERVRQYAPRRDGRPLRYADAVSGWRSDPAFRRWFIALLAEAPFAAYFWEMPPVTRDTVDQTCEFVLVDSPALGAAPVEPGPFAAYFRDAGARRVVAFDNLGGDAHLVVPCPDPAAPGYPHLAAFTAAAPPDQQHALWAAVGDAVTARLGADPLWVSTAGLGVYWLHVRLDRRPKYYSHAPYRQVPGR